MVLYDTANLLGLPVWLLGVVLVWSIVWKGLALWKSAGRKHMVWFIIILVVNTLGILEILYIFLFSRINLEDKTKRKTSLPGVQKKRRGK